MCSPTSLLVELGETGGSGEWGWSVFEEMVASLGGGGGGMALVWMVSGDVVDTWGTGVLPMGESISTVVEGGHPKSLCSSAESIFPALTKGK